MPGPIARLYSRVEEANLKDDPVGGFRVYPMGARLHPLPRIYDVLDQGQRRGLGSVGRSTPGPKLAAPSEGLSGSVEEWHRQAGLKKPQVVSSGATTAWPTTS